MLFSPLADWMTDIKVMISLIWKSCEPVEIKRVEGDVRDMKQIYHDCVRIFWLLYLCDKLRDLIYGDPMM